MPSVMLGGLGEIDSGIIGSVDHGADMMQAAYTRDDFLNINRDNLWQGYAPTSELLAEDSDGVECWINTHYWEFPEVFGGTHVLYTIVGTTRAFDGSILGGVTVKLFLTATDQIIDTELSDSVTGSFSVSSPYYPDAHYLVYYKVGTPDVHGSSVNTIQAQSGQ